MRVKTIPKIGAFFGKVPGRKAERVVEKNAVDATDFLAGFGSALEDDPPDLFVSPARNNKHRIPDLMTPPTPKVGSPKPLAPPKNVIQISTAIIAAAENTSGDEMAAVLKIEEFALTRQNIKEFEGLLLDRKLSYDHVRPINFGGIQPIEGLVGNQAVPQRQKKFIDALQESVKQQTVDPKGYLAKLHGDYLKEPGNAAEKA